MVVRWLLFVLVAALAAGCAHDSPPPARKPSNSARPTGHASSTRRPLLGVSHRVRQAHTRSVDSCLGSSLRLSIANIVGGGGHADVSVRAVNHGARACELRGYPRLTVIGCRYRASESCTDPRSLTVRFAHLSTGLYVDRGMRPVRLAPNGSAEFDLGTIVMGPSGRPDLATRLVVRLPDHDGTVSMNASLAFTGVADRRYVMFEGPWVKRLRRVRALRDSTCSPSEQC